jgi:hypothetical protein
MKQEDKELLEEIRRLVGHDTSCVWWTDDVVAVLPKVEKRLLELADVPGVSPATADAGLIGRLKDLSASLKPGMPWPNAELWKKIETLADLSAQRLTELTATPRYRLCDEDVARIADAVRSAVTFTVHHVGGGGIGQAAVGSGGGGGGGGGGGAMPMSPKPPKPFTPEERIEAEIAAALKSRGMVSDGHAEWIKCTYYTEAFHEVLADLRIAVAELRQYGKLKDEGECARVALAAIKTQGL